jgi:O-antigen/teichoic acid export membrane protein
VRNERRILLNTAALSGAEAVGQLANLLLIVCFSRRFGAAALGCYSLGMSVGAVAAVLIGMGLDSLLVRNISQHPARGPALLGVVLPIQLLLLPLAWAATAGVGRLLLGAGDGWAILLAASGYQVLLPIGSLLLTPLRAREQLLVAASCSVAHRLLSLLLGWLALSAGAGAATVALCFVAGGLFQILLAWVQTVRRCGRPRLRWSPRRAAVLYREAMPFFGTTTLWALYSRGTTILLGALSASREVGLYAVADRLMLPLALGPAMFNAAVFPALSRVASESLAAARELGGRCLRLLLVATVPLAALATVFAADIVQLFFGSGWLAAAPALRVLAWTLPVRGSQNLLGSQLAAVHRQVAVTKARFAGLCAFALLAPLLILWQGFEGAAWALLICDALQLVLYAAALRRMDAAPLVAAPLAALAAVAAATCAAGLLLPDVALLWRLVLTMLVMGAGLWLFGAIRAHDLRFLRTVLARRPPAAPISAP